MPRHLPSRPAAPCPASRGSARAGRWSLAATPATAWAGTLTEDAKLLASDGAAGDGVGSAVAVSGDTIVVGAPGDDGGAGSESGSANVFTSRIFADGFESGDANAWSSAVP
jgi:FG-GAP repeat